MPIRRAERRKLSALLKMLRADCTSVPVKTTMRQRAYSKCRSDFMSVAPKVVLAEQKPGLRAVIMERSLTVYAADFANPPLSMTKLAI